MTEIGNRMQLAVARTLAAGLRGALAGAARIAPQRLLPAVVWPAPEGAAPVGSCDVDLGEVDGALLAARCWYPAADAGGEVASLFVPAVADAVARSGASLMPAPLMQRLAATPCASRRDARPERAGPYPLVLLSHGLGGLAGQNSHLAEHLASHGYVVLAPAHPGGAAAVLRPDGSAESMSAAQRRRLLLDVGTFAASRRLRRASALRERQALLSHLGAMEPMASENARWARTIGLALTRFAGGECRCPVPGLREVCDLSRVAAVGMSFGGSASATAAHEDVRLHAAVNLDGAQYGGALLGTAVRVPLLVLHSEAACFADGGTYTDFHYEAPHQAGRSDSVLRFVVRGAGHLSFTDLALFGSAALRRLMGTAHIDGTRMLRLTADVVRRFLDAQLRGSEQVTPAALSAHWPELRIPDLAGVRALARNAAILPFVETSQ